MILLTGRPGAGKSTAIAKVAQAVSHVNVVGVVSEERRLDGRRAGFQMRLLGTGESGLLASPEVDSPVRFGTARPTDGLPRLGVTHDFLDRVVCPRLAAGAATADLLVIDEIGQMQASSPRFRATVNALMVGDVPIVASVSLSDDPWITAIREASGGEVFGIAPQTREETVKKVIAAVTEVLGNRHA